MISSICCRNCGREAFTWFMTTGFLLVMFSTIGLTMLNGISLPGRAMPSPSAGITPAPKQWNETWGWTENDYGNAIWGVGTRLYVAGQANTTGSVDFGLAAWNQDTHVRLWNYTWGGAGFDSGAAVWGDTLQVYTLGRTQSYGALGDDFALVAWNALTGQKAWNETWGGKGDDNGLAMWGDGTRLYSTGYTTSYGFGSGGDLALVAWSPVDGHVLWNRTWGGMASDAGSSVWGDGTRIYSAGSTESFGAGGNDFAIIAWDPVTGAKLWNTTWGGAGDDWGFAVWGDGTQVYVAGCTYSFGAAGGDFAIVACDVSTGALLWNTIWGGTNIDQLHSVWGDGTRIYVAGYSESFSTGDQDVVLGAVDPQNGNFLWSTLWGGTGDEGAFGLWGNGTMLYATGFTSSSGAGANDFALVAWDTHFTVSHPVDLTYISGTSDHSFTWMLSCATTQSGSYVISRDGVVFSSGTWYNNNQILVQIDGLVVGVHSYNLVATDGYGGQVEDMIDVIVTPPEETTPDATPDTTPDSWGLSEILQVVVIIMLGLVFVAVLLRGRPTSPPSSERATLPDKSK